MKGFVKPALISLVITVIAFGFLEGAISVFKLGGRIITILDSGETFQASGEMSETRHARHDPDLGWVNTPGMRVEDAYGPGTFIEINTQGFRNSRTFTPTPAEGIRRIICSGDSFTLGYGVSNPETWCNRLNELGGPKVETINMGQGAYGADQAYLWYKRDGVAFSHDMHLFAIIREDLDRMRHDVFQGYEKPVLRLVDGELVIKNVPVPNNLRRRKLHLVKGEIRDSLMLGRAAKWVQDKLLGSPRAPTVATNTSASDSHYFDDVLPVFAALMSDLAGINKEKNSRLAFVLLPTFGTWHASAADDVLRAKLGRITHENGIDFIDLTDPLRRLSYLDAGALFLGGTAGGHYSVVGNRFVAEEIFRRLAERGVYPFTKNASSLP